MMVPFATDDYNARSTGSAVPTILEARSTGYGYSRVSDLLQDRLQLLYMAGYGWTVTGHLKRKPLMGTDRTVIAPVLWDSVTGPVYRRTQIVAHIIKTSEARTVETGEMIKIQGKDVPKTKTVEDFIFTLKLGIVSHDIDKAEAIKTRYITEMPKSIILPRFNAWNDAFAAAYLAALQQCKETTNA